MLEDTLSNARILIVDDQDANIKLLRGILKRVGANSNLRSTTDPLKVVPYFAEFEPDLIILDLHMPGMDGFAVMEELRPLIPAGTYFPILVITADVTPEAKQRALLGGAKDFLTKPFDATEVVLRIRNLLETRNLHLALQDQNHVLEARVRARTRDLEEAQIEILQRLAAAAEYRDDLTGKHTQRVGEGSGRLARALGLPNDESELIRLAAPLHDVGKIGIPDHILLKPGGLTPEEFEVMKTHTTIGARILSGSKFPLLKLAEEIALTHHEHWDGTGYPSRLKGDTIPLVGRIVSVADAYDAFTSDRPYRKALAPEEAWEILWDGAGTQWDETVLEAFASTGIGRKGDRDGDADAFGAADRHEAASHSRR